MKATNTLFLKNAKKPLVCQPGTVDNSVIKYTKQGEGQLSATAPVFCLSPAEKLYEIRGNVSSTGTALAGTGYTCASTVVNGANLYTVTFNTAFTANPTVNLTWYDSSQTAQTSTTVVIPVVMNITANSFMVHLYQYNPSGSNFTTIQTSFTFTAVGPGSN